MGWPFRVVEWSYRIPKQNGLQVVKWSRVGGVELVEWSDYLKCSQTGHKVKKREKEPASYR